MRYIKLLILFTAIIFAAPLQAQSWLQRFQRAVASTSAAQVSTRSQLTNASLYRQLSLLFKPPVTKSLPRRNFIPKQPRPISFLVQTGPNSNKTASAFALKVKGSLVGVTAGHVMHNISAYNEPHLAFPDKNGKKTEFRISDWRITNRNGTDVAVFQIPPEALPYVQPLEVAEEPVLPLQTASIAGFVDNAPTWLPNEEILFIGAQRFLLRNSSKALLDGLCGSPVIVNGKVAGLYAGYFPKERLLSAQWADVIRDFSDQPLPNLHQVAPIEYIFPLVEDLKKRGALKRFETTMKVFDFPVAVLQPTDQIFSVMLLRNGFLVKKIFLGPLVDPEHLENFFELQENDVLRVTIFSKGYTFINGTATFYDVNVSTGKVTSFQR